MPRLIDADLLLMNQKSGLAGNEEVWLREDIELADTVKAISLDDVFRLVAGHSNYHGDSILSAFTCLTEGKQVNSIKPIYLVERKDGKWERNEKRWGDKEVRCSICGAVLEGDDYKWRNNYFCYHCGSSMKGEVE